ncbi:MAG: tetratricopeptide repeat protein [Lysobacterales bacterium]|jgi:tetratricopeptide (TPR) repeat protein
MKHMFDKRILGLLLAALSLAACTDKGPGGSTAPAPKNSGADTLQATPDIEQMKNKLLASQNDFSSLSRLADRYFEAGQYLKAIQAYNKALAIDPSSADCLNDRGLAQYYTGDPDAALKSIDQAIASDPGYVHAWLSKGYVLVSEGRYDEAKVALNKVKELDQSGTLAAEADKFLARIAAAGGN